MYSASSIRRLGLLAVMASLTGLAVRAPAQFAWTATASGNWSTAANWQGGTIPVSGATTAITFGAGTYTSTDDLSTNPFLLNSLTFNNTGTDVNGVTLASANALDFVGAAATITRGTGDVTIERRFSWAGSGTPITLTTAGGSGTLTFSGTITDNGTTATGGSNIVKMGTGSLVFSGAGASSFNQLSIQSGTVSVTAGTLSLTAPAGTGNAGSGLQIGNAAGQSGIFNVNGGAQVDVTENIYAGDVAGSTGTINVSGAGTVLDNSLTGTVSQRLTAGNFGSGTINVTNGATVNTRLIYTGRQAGSGGGTILVDGATINAVSTASGTGQVLIGNAVANFLTVQNGGVINNVGNFFAATTAGSTATILITGVGSSLTVSNQYVLSEAGLATMTVQQGATVTVSGSGFIGTNPGGVGSLVVNGAGSTFTAPTTGDYMIFGGGQDPGGVGNLTLTNGAVFSGDNVTFAQNTSSGSTALIDASTLNIGSQLGVALSAGAIAKVTIQNGSTATVGGNGFVGGSGASGATPAAAGTLIVTGAGSTLSFTSDWAP